MYITINGIKLYYECIGKGNETQKTILFLSGNGTSFNYMMRLAKMLSKDYKVYLLDRRGQGKSEKKCDNSYELNVEDVYEFMKKMNILKPIIIGHSGGAVVTMMLGLKYKNSISKMVLCSGSINLQSTNPKYIKIWKIYSKFGLINKQIINMVLKQKDITENIKDISAKTLVLAGQNDIINKETTHNIVNSIKYAKLKVYENENHSSYILNAICYNDIIKFLEEE